MNGKLIFYMKVSKNNWIILQMVTTLILYLIVLPSIRDWADLERFIAIISVVVTSKWFLETLKDRNIIEVSN
jgi:Na+-transporting NADH:ubiquinone oxidoreductase subunit NqrB